jgi:predicted transcriptional regulator
MTKTQENNRLKFAAIYLNQEGKTIQNISKSLGVDKETISEILNIKEPKTTKVKTTTSKINSKDLMITQTAGKGTKNVAIMTKAASEVNDGYKKQLKETTSRTTKNAIYKPKS